MASLVASCGFALLTYVLIAVGAFLALLRVAFVILLHPFQALKKTPRDVPPACLLDPSLGTHEYVTANGLKFHCVTAGDKSKPLMLFVHGFPEFWFSWRYQLREFCKDYRVVAIDMRGYGDSERPPNKQDYQIDLLRQDIVELIPALGYSSCTLVAHDWGGAVAWSVVQRHPELVDSLVIMNCPHSNLWSFQWEVGKVREIFFLSWIYFDQLRKGWGQLLKSWYIFMFQVPWLPELLISVGDYAAINDMFRGRNTGACNKAAFPPDVVEAYKYTFSQPGALTAPLNYYRCMLQRRRELGKASAKNIEVPTLIIWGDDDMAFENSLADAHSSIVTNLTVKHIPNCSHWVQQDAPDLVNQYMREFLEN